MRRVEGVSVRAVVGNHGLEPSPGLPRARLLARQWQRQLATSLPSIAGVMVENKGPSLAIHYRLARARTVVRRRILTAVSDLRGVRVVEGKMVVNLLPVDAPHKGTALVHLCKRLRCKSAIFVGDDDTDEDVFALANQGGLLGIRVGRSKRSRAAYFIASQKHIDRLLTEIIAVRR
jgi:trehalose 6-phosphate phosphatase